MENTNTQTPTHAVLLYYCYNTIENPEEYREEHHRFCLEHRLLGRIIIANEGLNGTISGLRADCEAYMNYVKADPRFADTDFKIEYTQDHTFQKLNVRLKREIVHSGLLHLNPREKTGQHLSPQAFKEMKNNEEVIIVDMRSDYEYKVGRFKNAITLDIENFRDMPQQLEALKAFKDKKIITYCTGGVKCEKGSAFLLEQGFEQVYQLEGGIIKYGIEEGGEDFDGKCYVFDNRIVVDINKINPEVIATCYICGEKCDRMVNCANPECNTHVPICEACGEKMEGACSETCRQHPRKRPYNGTGYYPKQLNGYDPYKNAFRKEKQS